MTLSPIVAVWLTFLVQAALVPVVWLLLWGLFKQVSR